MIEVGSEWVSSNNVTWKVSYVGSHYVVINKDKQEICVGVAKFRDKYKPKPKTVTMYFYEFGGEYCAQQTKPRMFPVSFTREIELP